MEPQIISYVIVLLLSDITQAVVPVYRLVRVLQLQAIAIIIIQYYDNIITNAYTGIYAGAAATGVNNGLIIAGNSIGGTAPGDTIALKGINVSWSKCTGDIR